MFNFNFIANSKKRAWKNAQKQEFSWWNGVANTGYQDCDPQKFISEFQKNWMLEQMHFLDKPVAHWEDKTVVEFGPGPAGIVEYLKAKKKIAIEPLIENYRSAFPHLKNSNVDYIACAAEEADDIQSELADLSICFNVLDHTFNPQKVIDHLVRIAKKNSDILFQLNVFGNEEEFKHKSGLHAELHPHSFTKESLKVLLLNSGLKIVNERISEGRNPEGEFFFILHLMKL